MSTTDISKLVTDWVSDVLGPDPVVVSVTIAEPLHGSSAICAGVSSVFPIFSRIKVNAVCASPF